MSDYIPGADEEFQTWAENFVNYAENNAAGIGLEPDDLMPISTDLSTFNSAMTDHTAARQEAKSARQTKDDARESLESKIRQLVRQLQASPDVDDTERQAMGITVRDKVRTANAGEVTTRPIGVVDTSQRLRHEIKFTDESTPTSRAKPDGVMGCEIWVKVTAPEEHPPASADELSFVTLDTATPYTAEFDGADGGKTAHYMLRWVKTNGEKGPWSETVSATIPA